MSHLQKAFIAKNKGRMQHQPQHMTRGMILRQSNKVVVKETKIDNLGPLWVQYIVAPDYLRFTLKK